MTFVDVIVGTSGDDTIDAGNSAHLSSASAVTT